MLADGEFLTLGLLECIDVSPSATEAGAVECWWGLGVCVCECVCVVVGVALARVLRGPVLGVATGLLQSWPSSCRSLALSFLPEAFPVVPVAAVFAVAVAAAAGLSSCTSSILCGLVWSLPEEPSQPLATHVPLCHDIAVAMTALTATEHRHQPRNNLEYPSGFRLSCSPSSEECAQIISTVNSV